MYGLKYGHMKTTIDLPDALLRRAKRLAAERGTTLKTLMIEGLEYTTTSPAVSHHRNQAGPAEPDFLTTDRYGVPVLKANAQSGKAVTDAEIDQLRDELEI